jgi:hypothetical protein
MAGSLPQSYSPCVNCRLGLRVVSSSQDGFPVTDQQHCPASVPRGPWGATQPRPQPRSTRTASTAWPTEGAPIAPSAAVTPVVFHNSSVGSDRALCGPKTRLEEGADEVTSPTSLWSPSSPHSLRPRFSPARDSTHTRVFLAAHDLTYVKVLMAAVQVP